MILAVEIVSKDQEVVEYDEEFELVEMEWEVMKEGQNGRCL